MDVIAWDRQVATQVAASTEDSYRLLTEAIERWVTEIEGVTWGLLLAVEVSLESARCGEQIAEPLWRDAQYLADQLRLQLAAVRVWHRSVSEDRVLNREHLQSALANLRRTLDRASLVLGGAEITLATNGPSTDGIASAT